VSINDFESFKQVLSCSLQPIAVQFAYDPNRQTFLRELCEREGIDAVFVILSNQELARMMVTYRLNKFFNKTK
jgi:carbamoylphosphate synthase large subunit